MHDKYNSRLLKYIVYKIKFRLIRFLRKVTCFIKRDRINYNYSIFVVKRWYQYVSNISVSEIYVHYNYRKRHNLYTCLSNVVVCYFVYILLEYIFIYFNGHNLYTLYNVVMSFKVSRAAFMTRNQFIRSCNVFIILGKIAKLLNKNNSWTFFSFRPINRGTKIYSHLYSC